jgi:hypothetical protein
VNELLVFIAYLAMIGFIILMTAAIVAGFWLAIRDWLGRPHPGRP